MRLIDRNPKPEPMAFYRCREQPIGKRGIHGGCHLHAGGWLTVGINDLAMQAEFKILTRPSQPFVGWSCGVRD
jgi:hypothetical protein